MMKDRSEDIKKYKSRHTALNSEFSSWRSDYITISDFILPRRGRFFLSDVNKGGKTNNKIINNTGTMALRTLAAGMMAGITSPARPWFRLSAGIELRNNPAVRSWLNEVQQLILQIFAKSNLYNALPIMYTELGGFCTGCMVIDEDFDDVIRCTTHTAGSYRLAANKYGMVDTMYRDAPYTVQQLVDKFGFVNLSSNTQGMYNSGHFDKYVNTVHVIEPRKVRDHTLATPDHMPIASVWYEKSSQEGKFLRESGYEDNPLVAPRWIADSSDVYGTGPGYDTKGEIKALQTKERELAKATAKSSNPPMTGPTSMDGKANSVLPGHISFSDTRQGQDGFRPAYQVDPRTRELEESIARSEQRISKGFYEDLFLMLSQSDRREITAREVEERHEEKLLMLGPVLQRLDNEALDIIIDRTYNIAERNGLVPEPPEEIHGKNLKVEYISILHQAQKQVATHGIDSLAGYVERVAAIQVSSGQAPEALDKFNVDQSIDDYGEALGVSPELVNSDDDVAAIRKNRQQQQQQEASMAATQQAAEIAKTASQTDTGSEGTALKDILTQAG